ncbi:hypothetical protein AB0L68_39010 [Streptomyces sp. NPDC052164]|uniref:hypothetical protein n=1 Tax=Streptomyces sp. NPDC052164 TaxID=3155529 RepID=UPI00341941C0
MYRAPVGQCLHRGNGCAVALLGLGQVLVGFALATDHRGIAKRAVDTYLNPAHAGRQRWLVRVWGGLLVALGLAFLAAGIVLLLRT